MSQFIAINIMDVTPERNTTTGEAKPEKLRKYLFWFNARNVAIAFDAAMNNISCLRAEVAAVAPTKGGMWMRN